MDLVPEDNFYRKLLTELDLHFIYKATQKYYGKEGQESIDPVVFFKILLVGYLNNINSDRQLIAFCSDSLSIRLFWVMMYMSSFLGTVPLAELAVYMAKKCFLNLFKEVLKMCVSKGMVKGNDKRWTAFSSKPTPVWIVW